jgi:ssDNA-binding Zn-finger/Zn-ribbon topoisomerase 1
MADDLMDEPRRPLVFSTEEEETLKEERELIMGDTREYDPVATYLTLCPDCGEPPDTYRFSSGTWLACQDADCDFTMQVT